MKSSKCLKWNVPALVTRFYVLGSESRSHMLAAE